MKKILFRTLALVAIFGLIFTACKKESEKHEYTEEELAEIARQDSLKKIIPADYVFTQNVSIPVNAGYGGVTVTLDSTGKLLELFEYNTVPELVAALGTLQDGVQSGNDITFYAYNYSTKYEVPNPSTTNSFGHWFDANGDVCSWGDQANLFCEMQDSLTLKCTIGIFPDRPAIGTVFHIVEAMKYDTTNVAFLFNVTITDVYIPVTTVVGTQTIPFEAKLDATYTPTTLDFDVAAITSKIGTEPSAAKLYGLNADGSMFLGGFTANNGCWFNAAGDVCKWGDEGCAIFAEYDAANNKINVGQFPDGTVVGQSYTARLGFVNNLLQYNVVLTMTVTEPTEVGYPVTTLEATINLALTVPAAGADQWIDNVLDLDSAAIQAAIGCGPSAAKIYGINFVTDSLHVKLPLLTANNGCWFNGAGNVCKWGDDGISMYVEYRSDVHKVGFGQFPTACVTGQVYHGSLAFVNNDKRAEVRVAMTIQ
ncbi:MAG: hypothetical protein A2X22_07980 [Bacteroidetes bacterium GWF2_49_14]|nr:MAG: hypothetical protein A2X22_07980 [Bacteroidetes bacterium GWF2_49_14]HBB91840.1 hypothetical protein [Bacteroidales bacterium]